MHEKSREPEPKSYLPRLIGQKEEHDILKQIDYTSNPLVKLTKAQFKPIAPYLKLSQFQSVYRKIKKG